MSRQYMQKFNYFIAKYYL